MERQKETVVSLTMLVQHVPVPKPELPTVWCLQQCHIRISKAAAELGVHLRLYVPIFMSVSRLSLTHRGDVTILFLPRLPSMHLIHPSPLDGGGSL